ncbi:MAG: Ig-like domain-containing protein, partial [Bacteroidota bacterium]|nr:Ig-like domain-containing protein [Bacteroidota bacterium]
MKRNLLNILLILALSFASSYVLAETSDNFNSRTGVSLRAVKGYLQGNCWFFSDFDVNRDGWAPRMEGDGAMVSGTGANATARTGIYTPLLDIKGVTSVSFSYTFNRPVNDRRWIKLYAADADDKSIRLLDSLELTGLADQIIYTYRKSFTTIPAGQYKLFINYQGIGGEERIAIDQLTVSATRHYASTCNTAPVAGKDRFTGTAFHTAIGNVLNNDFDANKENLTAYLINDSQDGRVELARDGSFTFTPNPGFGGSSTHFSYKVCDNGYPALCSLTTMATIHFPYKSSLLNFQALYRKHAVDINWNTTAANTSDRFEVERSFDGIGFEKVGEVRASETTAAQGYAFTDKVSGGTVRKNDLYYRLRQVDAENRVNYSKVLIVRMYESHTVTAVSVTPDPGVNNIQVNVQLKEKSFVV